MTATAPYGIAPFDLDDDVAGAPSPSRPPRSRLVVFIVAAIALVVAAGVATVAVDQAMRIPAPDVAGSSYADAVGALERDGLAVDARGSTRDDYCVSSSNDRWCVVVSQRPAAGERLHARTPVSLVLAPIAVAVPDATGATFAEAAAALEHAGLGVALADPAVAGIDGHLEWTVATQSPDPGAERPAGTKVALTLERPTVVFAAIMGLPLAEVAASLETAGLTVAYALPEGMEDLERDLLPPEWVVTGSTPALDGALPVGELPVGTTVELEWGARVPDLVGMPGEAAQDALVLLGLEADFAEGSPTDTRVVTQEWAEGAILAPGQAVSLTTAPASVVFEVVTDKGGAAIVLTTPVALEAKKVASAKTAWRTKYSVGTTPDVYSRGMIEATATGAARSVTCSISVNGVKVATETAKGKGAVVTCQ